MYRIDPLAGIGWVGLTVSDLDRSVDFYVELLGMRKVGEVSGGIGLGVEDNEPLVILHEHRGARSKPHNARGLYHYAILLPSRRDLAMMFVRLAHSWDFDGFADHVVSEAIYLRDPDGHGIEIYADRPAERWRYNRLNEIEMATLPLNIDSLLKEVRSEDVRYALKEDWKIPVGTKIGHIHLHVSSLERAERFYHNVLGFDVTMRGYPGALFMSAGGYHHHIGANVWAGVNAPPPPTDCVQLKSFSIKLSTIEQLNIISKRLSELNCEVEEHSIHRIDNYVGVTTKDFDGNAVEIVAKKIPPS